MKRKILGMLLVMILIMLMSLSVPASTQQSKIKNSFREENQLHIMENNDEKFIFCDITNYIPPLSNCKDDEIDQHNGAYCGWGGSCYDKQAQSFIPTMNTLSKILIPFWKDGEPGNLKISIRSNLDGVDLTSITVTPEQVGTTYQWYTFDFEDIYLEPGEKYYILWIPNNVDSENNYYWGFGVNDPYPKGYAWNYNNGEWVHHPGWPDNGQVDIDFCFSQYGYHSEINPDLYCQGHLNWPGVKPGSLVNGSFTVENMGDTLSELDWEIASYPDWGEWIFSPDHGEKVKPIDGEVKIEVFVLVPDEEYVHFNGTVTVVNTKNTSDVETILVTLSTQKSRPLSFTDCLLNRFESFFEHSNVNNEIFLSECNSAYKHIDSTRSAKNDLSLGSDFTLFDETISTTNLIKKSIVTWKFYFLHMIYLNMQRNFKNAVNAPPHIPDTPIGPTEGLVGEYYKYRTKTIDPDNDLIAYGWDTDNDYIADEWFNWFESGQNHQVGTEWYTPGTYYLRVKAMDIYGAESGFSPSIEIVISTPGDPPESPTTPSGPSNGICGNDYDYTTSTIDPNNDNIQYGWDWDGDNDVDEWGEFIASGNTAYVSHAWSAPGSFDVKVKARDVTEKESDWSPVLTVTMENIPPENPTLNGPNSGKTGVEYILNLKATDPNHDQLYYYVDWYDGFNSGWIGPYSSDEWCAASHIFNEEGSYLIKAKVKDVHGAESDWSDMTIQMPKNKLNKQGAQDIPHN